MDYNLTLVLHARDSSEITSLCEKYKHASKSLDIIFLTNELISIQTVDFGKISTKYPFSTATVKTLSERINTRYFAWLLNTNDLELEKYSVSRMINVLIETNSAMVYSDYYEIKNNSQLPHPVNDYQFGSIRDDFDFGPFIMFDTIKFQKAVNNIHKNYNFAGLYDVRLELSKKFTIIHIPEFLYTVLENDIRKSGEKQFDYVNPKNREVQIEMEMAATDFLKSIDACVHPPFHSIEIDELPFALEASVIIPVKDRVKTLGAAIESACAQKTDFLYNVIIVDNHSTDGTTELIHEFAAKDLRIVHVLPELQNLGIGGCWAEAINNEKCGRFAIQLDSDDIYFDENTLTKIVNLFHQEQCAMVVGTYKMTDYYLNDIPPGIIDHKEWTPENGSNNALRINGLGAPRAFFTPLLREIGIPNVSYGEDYYLGLRISREFKIGRIYEPIYICRRWEGNSDADLDIIKTNRNNYYKDNLRTIEILARKKMNAETSKTKMLWQ
ncbi:MAG: glycosyltransferase family A protein [bacterium]